MRDPALPEHFDLSGASYNDYETLIVRAGYRGSKRIVPPAGEDSAFDVDQWARRVDVSVSPTGRSVRVWVDGEEVLSPSINRERGSDA